MIFDHKKMGEALVVVVRKECLNDFKVQFGK